MNDVKLRLGFVRLIIEGFKLKYGDETLGQSGRVNCVGNTCGMTFANNFDDNDFITSFAPRKNTGVQPVGDGVPVFAYLTDEIGYIDGLSSAADAWGWSVTESIIEWKPDINKLIKMQIQYDELNIAKEKPRMKTEYVKVTDSIFGLGADFAKGELYYPGSVQGQFIVIDDTILLAQLIEDEKVYRKVETEITWQRELDQWAHKTGTCVTVDFDNNIIQTGWISSTQFKEMCHLVYHATK